MIERHRICGGASHFFLHKNLRIPSLDFRTEI